MPPIRKLIEGGEVWLPFALSRLRVLVSTGLVWVSQRFTMPDGAEVAVSIEGGRQSLHIKGGGATYEFFTSEAIDPNTFSTPGAPIITGGFVSYQLVLGSGVRYKKGKSESLFSTALIPDSENPKWVLMPAERRLYEQTVPPSPLYVPNNPDYFSTWASWQNQNFTERVWWPDNKKRGAFVTSTAGISPGIMNMAGWLHVGADLQPIRAQGRDLGRDIPPAYYDKNGAQVGAPLLPSHIWWRHAAVQTVESEQFGSRKFFIMADTHGRFHVYPVKKYNELFPGGEGVHFTSLPSSMYKTYTPPYPAWVTMPDLAVDNDLGQWFWQFNKDATKAVSVPFKREPASMWYARNQGVGVAPSYHFSPLYTRKTTGGTLFIYDDVLYASQDPTQFKRAQEDTPGMVEFLISITISGAGDMDFSAEFTLSRTEYFDDNKRYIVAAGYLLEGASADGGEDDLVIAEVEAFWKPGPPTTSISAGGLPTIQAAAQSRIARYKDDVAYPPGYEPDLSLPTQHSYEAGLSDMNLGRFYMIDGSSIDGYFTVRVFDSGTQLRRIPLLAGEAYANPVRQQEGVGWTGFAPVVDSTTAPLTRTTIQNFDLRSMSFLLHDICFRTGENGYTISQKRLITFDMERADAAIHQTDGAFAPGVGPTPITPVPTSIREGYNRLVTAVDPSDLDAAFVILQSLALFALASEYTSSIAVHPDGSWSCGGVGFGDTEGKLDIIAPRNGKRASHRAVFNKAFGQNRNYSFYGDATNGGDGDFGSFCTTGIWIKF